MRYYTQYKGVWYKFLPKANLRGVEAWRLSSREDDTGHVGVYNADLYRLDQCFEKFFKQLEEYEQQIK